MCCFFLVSLFLPSPSLQFGHVQATLLIFLPVPVSADGVVFASEPDVVVKEPGVTAPEAWIVAGVEEIICHFVGSFGSCWI